MKKIIRALDTGYGNVKFTTNKCINSNIDCGIFPSWAVPTNNNCITGGSIQRRDTVSIKVDNQEYEVGPGIERAIENNTHKPLNDEYVKSPNYKALSIGALHYIGDNNIDLLVTGLPVRYLNIHADKIKNILTGTHDICDNKIHINKVKVLAQPLGGFIDFALTRGLYGILREKIILIIDVGYYTTDWITTRGLNVFDSRSGSFPGGMNSILKAVSKDLSNDLNINYNHLNSLDYALRKKHLSINGQSINPSKYLQAAEPYIQQSMNSLNESIGTGSDIEQIILVGGASSYFIESLRSQFPNRPIHTVDDPVFANVRGFQRIGEQTVKSTSVK